MLKRQFLRCKSLRQFIAGQCKFFSECSLVVLRDVQRWPWVELGELYAEIKFGLLRHAAHAAGSDGEISGSSSR